jgi:hypothetical protein
LQEVTFSIFLKHTFNLLQTQLSSLKTFVMHCSVVVVTMLASVTGDALGKPVGFLVGIFVGAELLPAEGGLRGFGAFNTANEGDGADVGTIKVGEREPS